MIYAGYPYIQVITNEKIVVEFSYMELKNDSWIATENYTFYHNDTYTGLVLGSAKILRIKVVNYGKEDATIIPSFVTSNYPVNLLAKTKTSDEDLNKVLEVCAHTLK